VETGIDSVVPNNSHLGNLRLCVVEGFEIMVARSSTTKSLRKTKAKEVSGKEANDLENEIMAGLGALKRQDVQTIRNLRREFSNRLAKTPPKLIVDLALKLIRRPEFIPRFFAYELIHHHRPALQSLHAKSLAQLGEGIDNWAAVDTFACYLAGPAWREGQVSDALIQRWAHSQDRWWKRAAVVSTVALNNKARGGRGDTSRTLMICEMLLADRDDMVVKALSWALRELSKRDPEAVRKFLRAHESKLAPRVAREVNRKLQTGLKNPRLKRI
jgi:3-methyladenine DNA glycosylase AlkD